MAYDDLQTKQDFIQQLYLEAKIWKLDQDTYRGPDDIKNWENSFILSFETQEREFIRNTKIIWRADDSFRGSDCPRYGIAGNIAHIQYLINDDRIHRDEIGIELDIWNEILELPEVILKENDESQSTDNGSLKSKGLHVDDFDSTAEVSSEFDTNETDITVTPDRILEALDKIVTHLTGKYYYTHTAIGAKYEAYINDFDHNVKCMASFWDKGNAFLPNELEDTFQSGVLTSWKNVVNELKFFFECDDSRETIIDLFEQLTSIAMSNDVTIMKFTQMRNRISKFMITNPKDFITCKDSYYGRDNRQTKYEELGPMTHTLLTCILYMASPLPKSKWRQMHDEYFSQMRKSPSYKEWHENRFQFNDLMDRELKQGNGVDPNLKDKCKSIRDTRWNDVNKYSTFDNGAKNNNLGDSSRCNQNQNMIGQIFGSKLKIPIEKLRNTNSQNFNPHTQNFNPQMQNVNPQTQNNSTNNTLRWNNIENNNLDSIPKCSHCTRLQGKFVRHRGPYQGRGDKCLYDTNGRPKPRNTDRFQYVETPRTFYIYEHVFGEINSVQRFEESRTRAVKVETVPRWVEERKFWPHNLKMNKKVETVPQCMTKGSRDEVTHMNKMSRDDVTKLNNDTNMNSHRDESFTRSTDKSLNRGMKTGQNLNEGKPAEISTLNESHRDERNFMTQKRKYIDSNPYLKCKFLNSNIPIKDRFGTLQLDSGAYRSLINESLLKFCRILKKEKSYDKNVCGADGSPISLADYTVDIEIEIENLGIFILRKVLVSTTPTNAFRKSFLLGLSDLNRLKINMDFRTKRVKFGVGPNRGKWIKMKNYL